MNEEAPNVQSNTQSEKFNDFFRAVIVVPRRSLTTKGRREGPGTGREKAGKETR